MLSTDALREPIDQALASFAVPSAAFSSGEEQGQTLHPSRGDYPSNAQTLSVRLSINGFLGQSIARAFA
eukprot:scaffold73530_cov36-Prasinocladus_malaysianus.AAC.1